MLTIRSPCSPRHRARAECSGFVRQGGFHGETSDRGRVLGIVQPALSTLEAPGSKWRGFIRFLMVCATFQLAKQTVGTDGCADARRVQRQRARRAHSRAGKAPTTPV